MSSGDSRVLIHSDELYRRNRERIEKMQEIINAAHAANEQGKRNYEQMAGELQRKIQEGEEAQRMLIALQQQTAKPLLTYHEPGASPAIQLPLLSYPPGFIEPVPSARIEEVPSPQRHPSNNFYQQDYAGPSYQAGYEQQQATYQPYPGSNYQNPPRHNLPGSLAIPGTYGDPAQSAYSREIPSQQIRQAYSDPRATPPFIPPQTVRADYRPPPQSQLFSAGQQSNLLHSYSQQQDSCAAGASQQSNSGPRTRSRDISQSRSQHDTQSGARQQTPSQSRPPAATASAQSQPRSASEANTFAMAPHMNQRHSRSTEPPPTALPRQPNLNEPSMFPMHTNIQVPSSAQPNTSQQEQSSFRAPRSFAPTMQAISRPHVDPQQRTTQASAVVPQALQRPEAKENHPSSVSTQPAPKPSVSATTTAAAPSYGISPFAYVPASTEGKAPPQPNPNSVPARNPAVSAPSQGVSNPSTNSRTESSARLEAEHLKVAATRLEKFLKLVNLWQKASPPSSVLDIPHAQIRVRKLPGGEIHFIRQDNKSLEMKRIPIREAILYLLLEGRAGIFVTAKGIPTLLLEPLSAEAAATHKPFKGVPAKDAPDATFPDPPSAEPAPAKPHDVLRALGKGQLYAAEEDSVRYAKRRAVEGPGSGPVAAAALAPALEQFVAWPVRPIRSNESSAKTTPVTSRAPSPSVPVPVASRQQVPLFLPDSPVRPKSRATSAFKNRAASSSGNSPDFYVLVPPAPEYVRRYREKMRVQLEQEEIPIGLLVQEEEEDQDDQDEMVVEQEEQEIDMKELKRRRALGMYQNTQNQAEATAMLEAFTRIGEVPCKWFECKDVLNSFESLITHLHEVHAQENEELSTCFWELCGESFMDCKRLAVHAETHVLETIHCAHQDCDEVFSTPRALVEHNLGHAEENSPLKASARPSPPQEPLPLPELAENVPAWALFAPGVRMPNIPKDRHMTLGPWVLRNIYAPVNVRTRRYNAAMPLSGVKAQQFHPDYEFLETSSMHYSCMPSRPARAREMADLNTKEVSDMLANGQLVLWPSEHKTDVDAKPPTVAEEEMAVEDMLQMDL
ncbi:hypothetical protein B0H11DRAFT_2126972 [Mycena galericulata]|nr:hypothetical protein B0H11DRAFT_2126972 [Mycena galericulata]